MKKKDRNQYPKGWNAARVKHVIAFYDRQTDEQAAAEIEAAEQLPEPTAWVQVPTELLPHIQKMVARHRKTA